MKFFKKSWSKRGPKVLIILCSFLFITGMAGGSAIGGTGEADLKRLVSNLHWLGHDSFRIDAEGLVIYLDPFQLKAGGPKADLILITHEHRDHCSPEDVAKIQKADTVIVTIAKAAEKLSGQIKTVKPGDELTVKNIPIKAIPAYNVNKFRSPGVPFHPKESGHMGYLLTVKGVRIYHAGDTDFIPEMQGLAPDVALLPVSGIYVMTAEEAAQAALAIQPKVAVPMHVGGPVGVITDADRFREKTKVPVMILPLEK
jgi:L-ascorbate metabolism protein UlaG (beta-lactamase superfamily)